MKIKKLIRAAGIISLIVVLLVSVGILGFNQFLKSDRFKRLIIERIERVLSTPVEIQDFDASLFSGVKLQGILIRNKQGLGEGYFLKADELVLRYDFFSLLCRRIRITEVRLINPDIQLMQRRDGIWNFPQLPATREIGRASSKKNMLIAAEASPEEAVNTSFTVEMINISGGKFTYLPTEENKRFTLHSFGLNGKIQRLKPAPKLNFDLSIEKIDLPRQVKAENLKGRLRASEGRVYLDEVSLNALGGMVLMQGESTIPSERDMPEYEATITVEKIDIDTIVSQYLRAIRGTLKGTASAEVAIQGKGGELIADVKLTIPSLKVYNQMKIGNLESNIHYSMPEFKIKSLSMDIFGGSIEGKGSGSLTDPANPSFEVELKIWGIDAKEALISMGQEAGLAKGKIKGDIYASGTLKDLKANGALQSNRLNVAQVGTLTDVKAPFTANLAAEKLNIHLNDFSAKLYGGTIGGKVTITYDLKRIEKGPEFSTRMKLSALDINEAVKALTKKSLVTGTLGGKMLLSGETKNINTLEGKVDFSIKDGRISGHPIQNVVALVLQMPNLRSIDFLSAEFLSTIEKGIVNIKKAYLENPGLLKFSSEGKIKLKKQELLLPSHLSIHRSALSRIPQIAGAFTKEDERWYGIDFTIFGSLIDPKTDLTQRLTGAVISDTLRRLIDGNK